MPTVLSRHMAGSHCPAWMTTGSGMPPLPLSKPFLVMTASEITLRLSHLRQWMNEARLSAFVVPTTDPHNSEYTPAYWMCREWLTGFTGSAGTAVVTLTGAALWTDSRYFLQAEDQLAGTGITLMREGVDGVPTIAEWLNSQLPGDGSAVGFSAQVMSAEMAAATLSGLRADIGVQAVDADPFATLWQGRPALPATPLRVMPDSVAGESARSKLHQIFAAVRGHQPDADLVMVNDLSEIAWTLNMRADDIPYNPLFVAYLAIGEGHATLFTATERITPEAAEALAAAGVSTAPYDGWAACLDKLPKGAVIACPATMNMQVTTACTRMGLKVATVADWPVPLLKSMKNAAEQQGFREAMERDGVAMVRFLRRFYPAAAEGVLSEVKVDEWLTAMRAEEEGFVGLSFPTIAGYAAHGSIVHYEATPETDAPIAPKGLLLLDSGAQYDCGTTDITRTLAAGPLTDEERRAYTLVLKGHLALQHCRFPRGTTGLQLDTAARYAMWQAGYDFGHGTGHGVGHQLCVHEGPQQIRKNVRTCTLIPLVEGMTITDEPGIYAAGQFGVRIENTLLVVDGGETPYGRFLAFEPLTLCPYDLTPVCREMLSDVEVGWINAYHATVRERLLPRLTDEADRQWLISATEPMA